MPFPIVCYFVACLDRVNVGFAALPVFWTANCVPVRCRGGRGGIAIINSIGNLAGFVGPYIMGAIKDSTGSFTIGLPAIAGLVILAMLVALSLPHDGELETLPDD